MCLVIYFPAGMKRIRLILEVELRSSDLGAQQNGETSRNLSTRMTEHKCVMMNGDVNNHIAEHHLQTKHQIVWDSVTCIT